MTQATEFVDHKQERPSTYLPWMGRPTPLEQGLKILILTIVVLLVVYPFMSVIATSIASTQDVLSNGGLVIWPEHPSLQAYQTIFQGSIVVRAGIVSIAVTTVGTILSLCATIAMAYGLSRQIWGAKIILMGSLFALLFVPGIIPSYLMVKQLGLLNTYASLILPVLISPFNLVVMRQFFMQLPQELFDAAKIDGANDWKILIQVVLPLSKAVIAVIGLFYAVAYWNAFFNALLYLNDSTMWPLPLIVRLYVLQGALLPGAAAAEQAPALPQTMQTAVVVVATLPILVVYPFVQRYFSKGVLTGAIKG